MKTYEVLQLLRIERRVDVFVDQGSTLVVQRCPFPFFFWLVLGLGVWGLGLGFRVLGFGFWV